MLFYLCKKNSFRSFSGSILLLISIMSCSVQDTEKIFLKDVGSIAEVFHVSKEQKKGVILISNMTGCAMCEFFEIDLLKKPDYAEKIYKEYIIVRMDHNSLGNEALARILNNGHFPVFLFFDQQGNVKGIKMGTVKPDELLAITKEIRRGGNSFDEKFHIGDSDQSVSVEKIQGYLNNLFKAQIEWEDYIDNKKDSVPQKNIINLLDKGAGYIETFYANYLKSKFYQATNDNLSSKKYAEIATRFDDKVSVTLNKQLYLEIAFILNKPIEDQVNTNIGIRDIAIDIGEVKEGESKIVRLELKNLGSQIQKINNVTPSCNCSLVRLSKEEIVPNEQAQITIEYKANKIGKFSNIVELNFEAKDLNLYYLMKGTVVKP